MTDTELLKKLSAADLLKQSKGGKAVFTRDFKGRVVIPGCKVIATGNYCELYEVTVEKVTPKGVRDKNGRLYLSRQIYRLDEE